MHNDPAYAEAEVLGLCLTGVQDEGLVIVSL